MQYQKEYRLGDRQKEAREVNKLSEEAKKEYANALNRIAQTRDGKVVLKGLLGLCGVYNASAPTNETVANVAKRHLWLDGVRRHLTDENKINIEIRPLTKE